MTTIFSRNDNFDHFECIFVHLLSLYNQYLFNSQLEISHVLNGTTPEIKMLKGTSPTTTRLLNITL